MEEVHEATTVRPPDGGASAPEGSGASATKSPTQWANARFPANAKGKRPFEFWKHAAADALHGWSRHAYHEGEPMQLSAADYAAAIEAVVGGQPAHPAARSKHKRVRNAPPEQPPVTPRKETR